MNATRNILRVQCISTLNKTNAMYAFIQTNKNVVFSQEKFHLFKFERSKFFGRDNTDEERLDGSKGCYHLPHGIAHA